MPINKNRGKRNKKMEFTQLKFFLEVAKSQHVTKSAETLHVSQPSLTQSLHKLEDELEVPLFLHKGRNVYLSEYGKILYERLLPVMTELDNIPYELKKQAKLGNETIKINVLAVSALVTEAIIKYRKNKNELNFQVLQSANSENCDLEISTKHGERQGETETDSQKIFSCSEKIYLAVPKVKKYENKTHISLTEVMDEGFICLFGSKQFRPLCDKICRHIGFKPNIIFESDNPAAVINMIGANIGVGFYPQFSWGKAQSEHIKLLEITDAPFYRDIVVTANLAKTNNEHLLDFYEFLVKFIKTKHKQSEKFNI